MENAGTVISMKGKFYMPSQKGEQPIKGDNLLSYEDFLNHYENILWISYRKYFPPIGHLKLTTDKGWGCVHRYFFFFLTAIFMLVLSK
jgi:hypothetical protein